MGLVTPPDDLPNGWTLHSYVAHNEALRESERRFQEERDRRYAEIAIERDKALRIKEDADRTALLLARDIQTYKDTKANELREQINSERGLYATKTDLSAAIDKIDATFKPLLNYMAVSQGSTSGAKENRDLIRWALAIIIGLIVVGTFVFRASNGTTATPQTQQPVIIYTPAPPGTLLPQPSSTSQVPQK